MIPSLPRAMAFLLIVAAAAPASSQSLRFTRPHLAADAGDETATINGATFVNHGLVGVGRLSADTRDFAGETLGSFSSMAIDRASWRRLPDGSYAGTIRTLPDRGPNDVGPIKGTTDYRNRINIFTFTFRPYAGKADLPQATGSQRQLVLSPAGGTFLTDERGQPMTGKEPGHNVVDRGGILFPIPAEGEGAGRISLDSEGLAYARDGSFYVSDEYACSIYHFDPAGRLIGTIQAPPALLPRTGGAIDFNSDKPGETGRRNNQGLEALAITPDGRHLVTILQSAAMQDTTNGAQQTRNNSRILVYDIGQSADAPPLIGHFALQLPIFTQAGDGTAPDRTAAQSEMVALSDHRFLVLARDGIGRGASHPGPGSPVFKSVLLVDTDGATNLAGTRYETGTTPIAAGGDLVDGIVPARQAEFVNMLNPAQLKRLGMNLDTKPSTETSLPEKLEAMALVPALDPAAPRDAFLFVGNDNDFEARDGFTNGQHFDASLHGETGTGNNDNIILVYRVTLPGQ